VKFSYDIFNQAYYAGKLQKRVSYKIYLKLTVFQKEFTSWNWNNFSLIKNHDNYDLNQWGLLRLQNCHTK
jgi:hypothetical protein